MLGLTLRRGDIMALALPLWLWAFWGALSQAEVRLAARRELSLTQIQGGKPVAVTVEIQNEGSAPVVVEVQDRLPRGVWVIEGEPTLKAALVPGENARLEYTVMAHRGLFQFESVVTTLSDPWSFCGEERELRCPARLVVLPAVEDLEASDLEIRPRRTRVYAGVIPARAGGVGIEYFGSRPYRPAGRADYQRVRAGAGGRRGNRSRCPASG